MTRAALTMKSARGGWCVLAVLACAGAAHADWNPGDPHKMHYPQLPDPQGIDVAMNQFPGNPNLRWIGDDWRCSETGPVRDIHFWYSLRGDVPPPPNGTAVFSSLNVRIYSDVPAGPGGPNFSQPGQLLWERSFLPPQFQTRIYGTGNQAWSDPFNDGLFIPNDHNTFYQLNIPVIDDPFIQQVGTLYWLVLQAVPITQSAEIGWKTSGSPQHMDTAVWGNGVTWNPYYDPRIPTAAVPIDLAFVITPAPGAGALLALGALVGARRRRA